MRGPGIQQDSLFSTVSPEACVPKDHPLRPIRTMVDEALWELDADFNAVYADAGRDSIPPEKLLRAQLLMAFYTIRSERRLMEQINYNLLFRWFIGFSMDDAVWDHSSFSKNRDSSWRLIIFSVFNGLLRPSIINSAYRPALPIISPRQSGLQD